MGQLRHTGYKQQEPPKQREEDPQSECSELEQGLENRAQFPRGKLGHAGVSGRTDRPNVPLGNVEWARVHSNCPGPCITQDSKQGCAGRCVACS